MRNLSLFLFLTCIVFGLSLGSPGRAHADEIQPAIYILLDTSGSMIETADSYGGPPSAPWYSAYGDGSAEHPHIAGRTSRIYMAKNAIRRILAAYGEVRWGFARFAQTESDRAVCPCLTTDFTGYQGDVDPTEESRSCTRYSWASDIPSVVDKVCYNYTQGTCDSTAASGSILVPLGDDTADDIDLWVNHSESVWPNRTNPEIRAYGGTPLGGSLLTIRNQIRGTDLAADTLRGCRPYTVILLTDGDESCSGTPATSATALRSVVNYGEPCTLHSQCESGLCNTGSGYCQYEVETYVIAFALRDTANADAIANAGGTFRSIGANSEDELVSAMASIIASSIKPEWCNGVDDDCDNAVDEDFPVGVACDNGLLGACYRAGTYQCTFDEASVECSAPTVAPGVESCNGIDDDCDGLVDEGLGCPTPGPEMCNGADDDLDGSTADDGADDPSVGIACGSSVGTCELGLTKCIGGSVQCCDNDGLGTCAPVQGPVAEICDNADNDCDGTVDEGLSKACYPGATVGCTETTPGVFNCVGLCRTGIHTCSAGAWGACAGAIIPQAETCDAQDNDCDASTDEGLGSTSCGLGVCLHTVQNCSGGLPQNCDPMQGALVETCNNADDDCNGLTDDGLQRACYSGGSGCTETPPGSGNFVCVGICAPGGSVCGAGVWGSCLNDVKPRAEECNNLDDDCDNSIDESLSRTCYTGPAGTEGVGLCHGGSQACSAGAWSTCAGEVRPVSEACNNADDNCDGTIDNMGTITCGVGICNHSVQRCVAGVMQTCDPLQGALPEACNNVDDNCDGLVDQFYGSCYPAATPGCTENPVGSGNYTCTGLCLPGSRLCTAGAWGSCSGSVIPQGEVCDGLDNDCDGTPDDGLGSTTCGLGVCAHTVSNCSGGVTQTCNPMQGAVAETCNNADDDCDGVVDDGLQQACFGGASGCVETPPGSRNFVCTGTCRAGTSSCAAGAWGSCTADVRPVAEECNGLDDDCDGSVDEGLTRTCYTGPVGTEGVGTCHGGTQTCSAGAWGTCSGEVRPASEACNNADDNCDGTTDNMGNLTCGVGVCNHSVPKCVAGVLQTCDPLEGAIAELCNNVDDNCDGLIDSFYGGCYPAATPGCTENPVGSGNYTCTGLCQAGSRLCTAGAWGSCSGPIIPVSEVCDGLDNDCDGTPDDGLGSTTCGLGVCLHTIQNCSGGTMQTCDPMQGAVAETCNNADDDCDGVVDDGLLRACYDGGSGCVEGPPGTFTCTGTCRAGTSACAAGGWGTCTADVTPVAEECNGLDDDCDGSVDEGLTRTCYTGPVGTEGVGTCHGGTQTCSAGAWGTCSGEVRPVSEACNNADDNCDGTTDNMGDLTCGVGVCNHSVPKCVAGVLQVCDPLEGAVAELCNNVDDNCDGLIDSFYGGCYPAATPGCTENPPGSGNYTCTGLCQAGSRLCTAGAWGSCSGPIIPVSEVCDGLDNDCDGTPDDGLGSTTCGLGVCLHTIQNCSGGTMQTCDPMQGAVAETCNNADDDCDGVVDDGLLRACYGGGSGCVEGPPGTFTCTGICRTGNSACNAGTWGACLNDVQPRAEECNGLDDDCDGSVDEGLTRTCYTGPAGTEGVGTCHGGTQACNAGAWGVCSGEVRPVTEACNNADDDCDGVTDDMGNITCGQGVCNHSVPRCVAGVLQVCDPLEGAVAELCNNVDDNCDGLIDQFYGGCYPAATPGCSENPPGSGNYTCTGLCQSGTRFCATGLWGSCSGAVVPQTEICDGSDNDCDGQLDEGFGTTTCGVGACEHTIANCSGGSVQVCNPMDGALAETCNNADDDCDGIIDDGLSRNCYSGATGCTEAVPGSGVFDCTGICAPGTAICAAGLWGSCVADVLPRTEECNALDDDCDGSVDESLTRTCYTGPDGTLGVGTCAAGSQSCGSGAWGTCTGETRPVPEACNNADDDCNGAVDDMGTTTCGLGACLHTVDNCVAGVAQVCDPMQGAGIESCNGLDDDCDGQVDGLQEGCYPAGESGCVWNAGTLSYDCGGVCSPGVRVCAIGSGAWGACENAVIPVIEFCDGLDNDCDGQVDENLTEVCYPPGSGPGSGCEEQVDGTWICQGICSVGSRECAAGGWGNCQGLVIPEQEVCDTIDNDCDGETDEGIPGMGQPCGGVGVCAPGIRACINGSVTCDGGGDPEPGLCDGLDNNCNGLVDEPAELIEDPRVGADCGEELGACTFGSNECINGAIVCVGGNGPTSEICNGIDDDCNGEIDTGDICQANHVCYTAECRLICDPADEQACPAGYACIEPQDLSGTHLCYPQLAPCGGVYCAEDEVCREGACANPCEADPCDWFERCWVNRYSGQVGHETEPEYYCFDDSCSAPGRSCPSGELCVNHTCVDDPCAASPCNFTTEYCVRSDCETLETCNYECLLVPFCDLGERWDVETQACVSDACAGQLCDDGQLCVDGACQTDPCYTTNCDWGDTCILGECVDDPCADIKCPSYTHCYIDQAHGGAWCEPNPGVWTPPIPGDTMTTGGGSCSSAPGGGTSAPGAFLGLLLAAGAFLAGRGRRPSRPPFRGTIVAAAMVAVFSLSACEWAEFSLETPSVKIVPDAEVIPDAEPDADADADANPCVPAEEVCDGLDNDCNDIVDDYWTPSESGGQGHFSDDIFNCGRCGNICAYVHAAPLCVDGQCQMGACHPNWYDFDDRDENGCETSCLISAGGTEICDGTDNDCNGVADDPWIPVAEGGQDGFMTDANNCGECGRVCAFPNGQGSCVAGACTLSGCNENYVDTDGSPANGCECIMSAPDDATCDGVDNDCSGEMDEDYSIRQCYTGMGCADNGDGTYTCQGLCTPGQTVCTGGREQCQNQTGPAIEACDGLDNDCDGTPDEGFDLQVDVNHCGACNHSCAANAPPNMRSVGCAAGACAYVCRAGFFDHDPGAPGCEYACAPTNGGVERCDDGVDNDCDGGVDEFNALTDINNCGSCGFSCQANAPANMDAVSCTAGTCNYVCAPSYYDYDLLTPGCETFCQVSNGGVEACDALDNDCNGQIDETFDKTTDALHCGACNYRCSDNAPANMTATGCVAGNCQFECTPGHYNYDGLLSNGCEYACTVTNGGVELCDNLDNDCNGSVDVNADGTGVFQACYTGPGGTDGVGTCSPGTQRCFTGTWGPCQGETLPVSEVCDTVDNDCDGAADEDFDLAGSLFHCGACNRNCNGIKPPNTSATGCVAGVCQYQCLLNTYDMNGDRNTIGGDGCEYECTFTNGGVERCDDGVDNDCDGTVDEYNALTDQMNCGSCGHVCETSGPPNMNTTGCVAGTCLYECMPNYYDYSAAPGCEYYCAVTNGGTEACDGVDNDCDGTIDEGVNITTDMLNCGSCGYECADHAPANMTPTACVAGACQFTCLAGHYDRDGLLSNGCEYACTVTNGGVEICDNIDNDCNGSVDRHADDSAIERSCYTGPGGTEDVGLCHGGTQQCFTGTWGTCSGQVLPSTEQCDTLDNDCNGAVDNGFDLNTNLYNCGSCNRNCNTIKPPNTSAISCVAGACQYQCVSGTYDLNGNRNTIGGDGCEYACVFTNGGVEDCGDGVDNDCDGTVDEFNALTDSLNCGSCGHVCETSGPPNMNTTGCVVGVCQYTCMANYYDYTSAPGCEYYCAVTNGGTEACDGVDNDCDGTVDEGVNITTDLLNCGSCGYRCADHAPANMTATSCVAGACQFACQAGHYNLDGLLSNGCEYACTVTNGGVESCDNVDNDCNGTVDRLSDGSAIERSCYTGPGGTENVGPCRGGTQQCFTGTWGACSGQVLPATELCDTLDNDCNGTIDNGFDLNTNLYNCGSCGRNCNTIKPPNTSAISCVAGACQYQCVSGTYDLNANRNVIGGDGCEYACVFTNGGVEDCDDGVDNDCDGTVDEFNSATDPLNCGACGHVCETSGPPNMNTTGCVAGVCQYTCMANYYDYSAAPGCEYYCAVTNGGTEACDAVDNDCDGTVDEGVNITTDLLNCGSCGYRCADHAPANMTATACVAGACQFACQAGHYNLDGLLSNGCEYACTVTNGGVESCDNTDNDCNGTVDRLSDGSAITRSCYTGPGGTENVGPCHGGTQQCFTGTWGACGGQVLPVGELCDTVDNDCNGTIDNGFDLNTNLYNCGSCGRNCNTIKPPNTSAISCAAGVCQYQCVPGAYDLDGNRNVIGGNGCEYLCATTNGGVEDCDDAVDNDCDGTVDEFNAATDPLNCGSCGHVCEGSGPPNMNTTGCVAGVCQYTCAPNYYDYSAAPGCEYYCAISNGGTEACDGLDNDCDNSIDETFNKATDVNNCGACGYVCSAHAPANMTATGCAAGNCTFACQAGHYNYDGLLSNGCEYACTVTNGGVELCDNLDNDCDGVKDEDAAGDPLEQGCYTGPGGTQGVGPCLAGTQKCFGGAWNACQGQILPQTELCDSADNDCDGTPDDGYNLNTDILNCGMCGRSCFSITPPNASVSGCSGGACQYTCNAGYHDLDLNRNVLGSNGCEYACEATLPAGSEDCNNLDDDCDGAIDEPADLIPPPAGYCKTGGACGGSVASQCQLYGGVKTWVCQYPAAVDRLAGSPNKVAYAEVRCDNLDNDCDLSTDEDFLPIKGTACEDGDYGLCKGTGTVVCRGDLTGTTCNITSKGTAQPETCDAVDNDCDGLTDEPPWNPGSNASYVVDEVEVVSVGGRNVSVYKYESSRPAATAVNPGVGNPRACSRPDVLPWNRVTYAQAQAACSLAGARLCKADEWQEACEGASNLIYPYGNTYEDLTCNGYDYLMDEPVPTGDAIDCVSTEATWDMSGNLREWTMDYRGQTDDGENLFTLRGGSYLDYPSGLTCQFDGSVYVETAFTPQVGFRCCNTCGNGTVESDELCDDGNRVNGDGCDYMCAPTAGQTCGNGVRQGTEQCDDGNRVAGDGCSPSCRWDYVVPRCGNGVKEEGENCDDGNAVNGDGCNSNCTVCNGVFDAFGYERCTGGATFTDISGSGVKLGRGDEGTYTINLPFTFSFYGRTYNIILAGTNGEVHFAGNTTYGNTDIPTSTWQAVIMPFWDDLDSSQSTSEGVWWHTTGSSPNRKVYVQWLTRHYSTNGTNDTLLFQVQIDESTHHIHFLYQDVSVGNGTYNSGASATVGIQGYSPMNYYHKYSYNTASLSNGLIFTYYHP